MASRRPSILRLIFGNVWTLACFAALGSCAAVATQLILQTPPFDVDMLPRSRLLLTVPVLFGALAGLYGVFASIVLSVRGSRTQRLQAALRDAQSRAEQVESLRMRDRARIEELSVLREVATVVNQ